MNKTTKIISGKAGLPPGALIHVGKQRSEEVKISVIDYNETDIMEIECKAVEECFPFKDNGNVSWVNVNGIHDIDAIGAIGNAFGLHPLLLEDVLNTRHRPKVEEFDNCIFLTLKMLGISKDGSSVVSEQVSFVLGPKWVISFQEQQGDIFNAFRLRLHEGKGNSRKQGADYLLYRLIDTVVDNYFFVIEHFNETTEKLETTVLHKPTLQTLENIQRLKKQLIKFRKSITPLREAVGSLQKEETPLITKTTIRYLRDVYEHIVHVNEYIDTQRDLLTNVMDLYHSGISNRMNEVMQVLTIIATIFIPLTFIVGIYGMNFDNMPELHWKYGYFGVWGLMIVVLLIMVFYFKRRRWL